MKTPSFIKQFNVKTIIVLSIVSVTWVNFNQERWKLKDVIAHDIVNYYAYLPALFYEKDLSLSFLDDDRNIETEQKYYAPNRTHEGKAVIKMSMGMAVSYLPFFALAHTWAVVFDYPVNGFSEPYHFALLFSSLFYHVIGLIFIWRILRMYFTVQVSTLTLFCLSFATNVFYYLTMAGALSHTVGFAFSAVFLFYTIQWHADPKIKYAVIAGLTLGFLTLVRPVNLLLVIVFMLYDIKDLNTLRNKYRFFRRQAAGLVTLGISAFLVVTPQLLYWKFISGKFFFNSYVNEHFYFNHPHVTEALFGFRKGWLVYTPLMIFSLAGFIFLRYNLRKFFMPFLVFFTIYIYVVFSWWCWWYGGSFGQRVLIDIYPVLAIPLAAFLAYTGRSAFFKRTLVYLLIVFFTALNLFQSMQAKYNILHYDSMTRQSYFKYFFSTSKQPGREAYLQHPDYQKAMMGEDED